MWICRSGYIVNPLLEIFALSSEAEPPVDDIYIAHPHTYYIVSSQNAYDTSVLHFPQLYIFILLPNWFWYRKRNDHTTTRLSSRKMCCGRKKVQRSSFPKIYRVVDPPLLMR